MPWPFCWRERKKSLNIGVCSICAEPHKEVSGKTDVFKFYTIDKPGFITGGFRVENAWKNYPVCKDCIKYLESGRDYLEKNLNFRFYGFNYLLIPRLLLEDNYKLDPILKLLVDTKKEISLKRKTIKRITDDDQEILETLTEQGDLLTLNFLFCRASRVQSGFCCWSKMSSLQELKEYSKQKQKSMKYLTMEESSGLLSAP